MHALMHVCTYARMHTMVTHFFTIVGKKHSSLGYCNITSISVYKNTAVQKEDDEDKIKDLSSCFLLSKSV